MVRDGLKMGSGVGYFIRVFSHTDLSHFLVSHNEAVAVAATQAAAEADAEASC